MRTLLLSITLCIMCSTSGSAQLQIDELTHKIKTLIENTGAIKELIRNKKTVLGQLNDIRLWQQQGLLEAQNSKEIALAYTAYATTMNAIAEDLAEELKTITSYKDLKSKRLDKFLKRLEQSHKEELLYAYDIYISRFKPAFSDAAINADSKAGILGSIVLILEFGGTLVSAIKSIFTDDTFLNESKDSVIGLAMNLVANNLVSKLKYPEWQGNGFPETETFTSLSTQLDNGSAGMLWNTMIPSQSVRTYATQNSTRTPGSIQNPPAATDMAVRLSTYKEDTVIPLAGISKGITVGNDPGMQLFTTIHPMQTGDRFWVSLSGQLHAQFYYFDEHTQSWMDPFGKGIIVGGASADQPSTVHLPSEQSYFEITGDTASEQFFILISTEEISEVIKTGITGGTVTGASFLSALHRMIPLKYPQVSTQNGTLQLPPASQTDGPEFYGVYITIDKVIHP
ncbi:MAG: hypothetical protein R3359_05480 [Marinirhabdus sp.]|nr:hypothetical protein [Marinirhabdus sp.]